MHHHTIFHQNLSNGCRYFQNGGRPPSWIFEIQILNGQGVYDTHFASSYQISQRSVKPLWRYRDFCDFQDGGRRHLGFLKIPNFNGQSAIRGQYASPCQILLKSCQTVADILRFNNLI